MAKLFTEVPELRGERVTLKRLTLSDADSLRELTESAAVYRWLPTFLFEQKYEDKGTVIERLYDECLLTSLILGVYVDGAFCGLAEIYGYQPPLLKASVGYRLLERCWGKGIATETLALMMRYLLEETDIRVVTASTMTENHASANVLKKNGFRCVLHGAWENWGYPDLTVADKWLRTAIGYRKQYHFSTLGGPKKDR